jgi:hypothetical protein
MAKLFVAFNFSSRGLMSRKITGFRKRFDPKYNHYSFPHMSMLAPFEVSDISLDELIETLKVETETFYFGNNSIPNLSFSGLGIYEHKKRNMLYLNPIYNADLQHCSDMVIDICKSFMSKNIKYKENKNQFLPLGVFHNISELQIVLEQAKLEFANNTPLSIDSISIYQSKMGIWFEKEILIDFEENKNQLLQLNNRCI